MELPPSCRAQRHTPAARFAVAVCAPVVHRHPARSSAHERPCALPALSGRSAASVHAPFRVQAADRLGEQFALGTIRKFYLARVAGRFAEQGAHTLDTTHEVAAPHTWASVSAALYAVCCLRARLPARRARSALRLPIAAMCRWARTCGSGWCVQMWQSTSLSGSCATRAQSTSATRTASLPRRCVGSCFPSHELL